MKQPEAEPSHMQVNDLLLTCLISVALTWLNRVNKSQLKPKIGNA